MVQYFQCFGIKPYSLSDRLAIHKKYFLKIGH